MRKLILILSLLISLTAGAQSIKEAGELFEKGKKCLMENNIAEGRRYVNQSLDMHRALGSTADSLYILTYNALAMSYFMEENYSEAVRLGTKVLEMSTSQKTPDKNQKMYEMNLGKYLYFCNRYAESARYLEKALPQYKDNIAVYDNIGNILVLVYDALGDNAAKDRLMQQTLDLYASFPDDSSDPEVLMHKVEYYLFVDVARAKQMCLRLLDMDITDEMRFNVYDAVIHILDGENNSLQCAEYNEKAAMLRLKIDGRVTKEHARRLYISGLGYFISKKYEKSVEMMNRSIPAWQQAGASYENIAPCYVTLGNACYAMKQYADARTYYLEGASLYELNEKDGKEWPRMMMRVADTEKRMKNYGKAIEIYESLMPLFKKHGMHDEYSNASSSLQFCYAYMGGSHKVDVDTAFVNEGRNATSDRIISEELSNLELVRKYLGQLEYAGSLGTIAGCYAMKDDITEAVKYYGMFMDNIRGGLRDEFRMLDEKERAGVWEKETFELEQMKNLLLYISPEDSCNVSAMAGLIYDACLLKKGILLNSSIEFSKVLASSGRQDLYDTFRQIRSNNARIEEARTSESSSAIDDILSLNQQNQELQLRLYKGCSEFADYTNYISYSWKDVRGALVPGDLAIEFSEVGDNVFDENNYIVATVLTSAMQQPEVVFVCDLKDAHTMVSDGQLFTRGGNIFWGALSAYLKDARRVFFSADGDLNRVGIEYIRYEGRPFFDQFEVYRLSSTKELCYARQKNNYDKVALFGSIDYNVAGSADEGQTEKLEAMRGRAGDFLWGSLDYSLDEINGIEKILNSGRRRLVARFTDSSASTDAFMKLDGTQVNLIHLATHGEYVDARGASLEQSMRNSRLVFAGANLHPENVVTAADVAAMNLRSCDLVVLSACETGLGKLGGDGVYGLQRGFKNAGVRTILMSINSVYDKSTADFMQYFYSHLMSGKSKRASFVSAQNDLRNNGYDDPKYWAVFILLDAL